MRLFLTVGITKKGEVEVIHGADQSRSFHRDEFQKMVAEKKKTPESSQYAEVRVVDISRGMIKRRRFAAFRLKGIDESGKRTEARTVKHKAEKAAAPAGKAKATRKGKGGKGPRRVKATKATKATPTKKTAKRTLGKLPVKKQSTPAKIAGPAKSDASTSSTSGAAS